MNKRFWFVSKLLTVLFLTLSAYAQVPPNGDFEQWSGNFPLNWFTSNVPGFFEPVTQSTNSHSGSFAARGEVVDFSGFFFPPFLLAGDSSGFPVSQRYGSLEGFYQFSPQGNDAMFVYAVMSVDTVGIGAGLTVLSPAASGYTSFNVPIQYSSNDVPNRCYIQIFAGDTTGAVGGSAGTFFLIDDVVLSGPSGINLVLDPGIPQEFVLKQNYPNPFNPSTTIEFSLPAAGQVSLIVYNALGQEVARLVDNRNMGAGTYRLEWTAESLPSGVYVYRLFAGQHSLSGKMILQK
jgi:hypothetical protein